MFVALFKLTAFGLLGVGLLKGKVPPSGYGEHMQKKKSIGFE